MDYLDSTQDNTQGLGSPLNYSVNMFDLSNHEQPSSTVENTIRKSKIRILFYTISPPGSLSRRSEGFLLTQPSLTDGFENSAFTLT